MICCFCGRHKEKDVAIEAGWVPAFWAHDKEWEGPVCVPARRNTCSSITTSRTWSCSRAMIFLNWRSH